MVVILGIICIVVDKDATVTIGGETLHSLEYIVPERVQLNFAVLIIKIDSCM